jgi:2-iminobutanoate/2-iminopropanoate deaminase
MQTTIINPWKWQTQMGYAQAVEVSQATHTLYCAGQAAMDANGKPTGGDMRAQISVCFDNLDKVLQQAGYSMANLVRLNYYTTSVADFFAVYEQATSRLDAEHLPTVTLFEVNALAFPELLVEIEATAVK